MEIYMCNMWCWMNVSKKNKWSSQCNICQKECSTPLSLERHRYSQNVKPFVCETCNEGFSFASELARHRVKHRKIKTFICTHAKCSKSFMRNSELTAHLNTHSGVKYTCDHCNNYETTDKHLFRQHQWSHADEKHYARYVVKIQAHNTGTLSCKYKAQK